MQELPAAERQGAAAFAAAGAALTVADPIAARMHGLSLSAAAAQQVGAGLVWGVFACTTSPDVC